MSSAFSAAFSGAFAASGGYVGPVEAQALLGRGKAAVFDGARLRIDSRVLIGPAGKLFSFRDAQAAGWWVSINTSLAVRESELRAALPAERLAGWLEKKRARAGVVAAAVVASAAKVRDAEIQRALLREADFVLEKWGAA